MSDLYSFTPLIINVILSAIFFLLCFCLLLIIMILWQMGRAGKRSRVLPVTGITGHNLSYASA